MPHIHTQTGQHDATVSAYILRIDGNEPRLLLHMHKTLHTLLQFGGHVELHETPWQAICHEILEESGYDMSQLKILQPPHRLRHLSGTDLHPYPVSSQTHVFPRLDHYHSDLSYAFVTSEESAHPPQHGESTHLQSFTAAQLAAIPDGQIIENIRETARFIFDVCLSHWEAVPASAST